MTDVVGHIDLYGLVATIPWRRSDERQWDDPKYQQFLTFTDKESYLSWRKEWKQVYAELSAEIRTKRVEWRAEGSTHGSLTTTQLFAARARARALLALRKASKVKAEALYQEAKEAVAS